MSTRSCWRKVSPHRRPTDPAAVAVNRLRLSLAIVVARRAGAGGSAVFGRPDPGAGPVPVVSPSPSTSAATTTPTRRRRSPDLRPDRVARPDGGRRPALDRAGHRNPACRDQHLAGRRLVRRRRAGSSFADDDPPVGSAFHPFTRWADVGELCRRQRAASRSKQGPWWMGHCRSSADSARPPIPGGGSGRHATASRGSAWPASRASTSVPGESTSSRDRTPGGSRSPVAGSTRSHRRA